MNGNEISNVGASLLAITRVEQDPNPQGTIDEIVSMGQATIPALEAADAKLRTNEERELYLQCTERALSAAIATRAEECRESQKMRIAERIENYSAVDVVGLAGQMSAQFSALKFDQQALVHLQEVLRPDSHEAVLESRLDVRRILTVQARISAAMTKARVNQALQGVFAIEGEVGFVGAATSALEAAVDAAVKEEALARQELADYRAWRSRLETQRRAVGHITSSQVRNAI